MAKQEKNDQILVINPPHELKFTGPFTSAVTSYITLTNPSDKKVCFKIKTTAPKQYCVRPNSGILDPQTTVEIAVSLQPQPGEFPGHENYKHKFMVQSMYAPDGEVDQEKMWKEIKPENLMDSKLKCLFESGPEQAAVASDVGGDPGVQEKKITNKSPKVSSLKASPKVGSQVEGELARAAAEVKSLREEESTLRQENLMLKEEVLRLRRSTGASSGEYLERSTASDVSSSHSLATQEYTNGVYAALAIAAIILGILLGKFLL